jgi:IS4 transposase
MFAHVIDSSQVRVQCGGSSRSAARHSRRSTQDPVEVEQLREELRRHQDYLKQQAAQHEYYATQIQQHETLIQVSSKDNSFHFKICIDLKR